MNANEMTRFLELRKKCFQIIRGMLEENDYCKSYEGQLSLVFPNYFQDQNKFVIDFDCYLIGDGRHKSYEGSSWTECLDKFEKELHECNEDGIALKCEYQPQYEDDEPALVHEDSIETIEINAPLMNGPGAIV